MGHDETHFGIVHGSLRSTSPCFFGTFVIGKNADDLDGRMIEIKSAWILDATAEHEVEFARHSVRLTSSSGLGEFFSAEIL